MSSGSIREGLYQGNVCIGLNGMGVTRLNDDVWIRGGGDCLPYLPLAPWLGTASSGSVP